MIFIQLPLLLILPTTSAVAETPLCARTNDSQMKPVSKTDDGATSSAATAAVDVAETATALVATIEPQNKGTLEEQQDEKNNDRKDDLEYDTVRLESRKQQQQQQQHIDPEMASPADESCSSERCRITAENVSSSSVLPDLTLALSSLSSSAKPAKARLEQTKSVALPDDSHPVAPPRYKKRQSVPLNNELMLRRREQLDQQKRKQQSCNELERMMIKVKVNEKLECGRIEHDDGDDGREIDRLPATASSSLRDMKQNQAEPQPQPHPYHHHHQLQQLQQQNQPSNGSGGTISSLFTKLMGKLPWPSEKSHPKSYHLVQLTQ